MKKFLFTALILLSVSRSYAQLPNHNMTVLANLNQHQVPPQYGAPWHYAAVWGYVAPDKREYAILGCALGTAFYDITDSANIREVKFFPAPIDFSNPDQGNLWREMKVYSHYAYVVSEADSSGVEIYDLQYLPDSVVHVKKFLAPGHSSTHSISQEGPYLYLNGGNASFTHGTAVLDLSADPVNPVLRGKWSTRYVHDCRVFRDTIFAMNINTGDGQVTVIDARNKDSLKTISQWLNLPNPSPHNCSLTKDRKFLYTTDEVGSLPRLLKVWNIEDLSNVTQITTWQPTGIASSIIHNVEIYGDTAVIAHYTSGVRVLNISNPASPVEIAWYDTYPANDGSQYQGCWGVYKFPSGKIAASDMNTGLYVLKVGTSVGVSENNNNVNDFRLSQNFPNPFNPTTRIDYTIPSSNAGSQKPDVKLEIYNSLGKKVASLVNEKQNAGDYSVVWNAANFPSGVYYYKLQAGDFSGTKKMILIR